MPSLFAVEEGSRTSWRDGREQAPCVGACFKPAKLVLGEGAGGKIEELRQQREVCIHLSCSVRGERSCREVLQIVDPALLLFPSGRQQSSLMRG
ncbi:hypothetical protein cyc_08404 [Cyclospora cayetanensis]|uniref:Uncharacterized protein n=1 Tax=Cyclospora cayetanensis TaxID=88456 RepID=A0A1D3D100_9EIME|nr:hypothetical protein cyc_08404 [Cyclospora cayetanensis]